MSIPSLSVVTAGFSPVNGDQTSLLTSGLFPVTEKQPGQYDSTSTTTQGQPNPTVSDLTDQTGGLIPTAGNTFQTSIGIPIGTGSVPYDLEDLINNPNGGMGLSIYNPDGTLTTDLQNNYSTYTGTDLKIIVDLVNTDTTSTIRKNQKQLIECTTFTVSIHREKSAVRAAGYINPKGFARGRRTIAGTMVLTQFTVDILYRFLMANQLSAHDLSKDTFYVKVDQLPPFNMTMIFTDEFGNASYRRVLGVDFVTDGVVYSTNDMMTEQTISYMASDFTPLLNFEASALFRSDNAGQSVATENTVESVMKSKQQFAIPPTNIFSTQGSGY
jgi:hypothetical protein